MATYTVSGEDMIVYAKLILMLILFFVFLFVGAFIAGMSLNHGFTALVTSILTVFYVRIFDAFMSEE